jgi:hypothetical protein
MSMDNLGHVLNDQRKSKEGKEIYGQRLQSILTQ